MHITHFPGYNEITFDIGKVNAFSRHDIQRFEQMIEQCETSFSEDNRVLVLKSSKISPSGFPIFCAGADQKERVAWNHHEILTHLQYQRSVIHHLRTIPQYVICCVDGLALGLGTEICLAADLVLATPTSQFGFPEKNWGIVPGAGGYAWAHGWAPHPEMAQHFIQTGERFDTEHAQFMEIIDTLCEKEDFDAHIQLLIEALSSSSLEEQRTRKKQRHEKIDYSFYFEQEQTAYAQALVQRDAQTSP